jgi:signal transduction histidine kinase
VLVAPAVGATIGAANVVLHDAAETYWRPWSAWFVSNALTGLAMMPATIAAFAFATGFRRFRFEAGRAAEALLMAIALAVTCAVAFLGVVDPRHLVLPLYAPLPVLIWAALRFGSGGASLALTAVAFAAILRADDGMGPFLSVSPDDNLIALQTFVLLTAAPVLCLAAIATARQEMAEGYRTLLTSVQDKETALRTSYGQVRQLANRLMTAQEEERTRIARELHDDFGQRIASLSIGLSAAKWDVKEMDNALGDKLSVLQQQMMTVAKDLRSLSHELHPSAFEHVGFVEALRARCDEVSLESGLNVRLDASEDCSSVLRDDAALCLYRIAQEALQNVVKHAHATSARVSLARHNGAIVMRVIDDGLGFEAAGSRNHPGLGLLSIRERVHMLGGRFEMRTSPGAGTIAEVTLPVGERG